jgi:hypothetical protein
MSKDNRRRRGLQAILSFNIKLPSGLDLILRERFWKDQNRIVLLFPLCYSTVLEPDI